MGQHYSIVLSLSVKSVVRCRTSIVPPGKLEARYMNSSLMAIARTSACVGIAETRALVDRRQIFIAKLKCVTISPFVKKIIEKFISLNEPLVLKFAPRSKLKRYHLTGDYSKPELKSLEEGNS